MAGPRTGELGRFFVCASFGEVFLDELESALDRDVWVQLVLVGGMDPRRLFNYNFCEKWFQFVRFRC